MGTNTIVLIAVTAMAALVLSGGLVVVVSKTRSSQRHAKGAIRKQADEGALRVQRQEALADDFDARAHAAHVEIDIKTVRACALQEQAAVHRSEAVNSRDQLNERRDHTDKLRMAAQTRPLPAPIGLATYQP